MQVHKITILVIDHDELGAPLAASTLENHRFPNDCLNLQVLSVETRDIGVWADDNPLNRLTTMNAEVARIFGSAA